MPTVEAWAIAGLLPPQRSEVSMRYATACEGQQVAGHFGRCEYYELGDIAAGLGMHPNEAVKYVDALLSREEITSVERVGQTFYRPGGNS